MSGTRKPRYSYKEIGLAQLRNFREVCHARSYAAAARNLNLTAPAVWEQINALEKHYGVPLFERHGNGVRPTAVGERLLELVDPHLNALDSSRDVLRQEHGTWPRQLSLASNLRVISEEISRGVRQFQRRHEEILLRIIYVREQALLQMVLDGAADVAFTLEPASSDDLPTLLEHRWSGQLDYLLLTLPDHPLARKRALRLQDLVRYPLVLGDTGAYSRRRVQEVFTHRHLVDAMSVAVETSSDEYTASCVRQGMGIGIAIGNPNALLNHGLAVRPLRRWFGTVRTGFIWKRGAEIPPAQLELMADIARAVPPAPKQRG